MKLRLPRGPALVGLGALGFGLGTFWSASLQAACDPPGRRWVSLQFVGVRDANFARSVSADLQAGLAERQIDVCPETAAASEPQLAAIQIERHGHDRVQLSVELHENGQVSHVSRDVDLARVPQDSRAFAVALAMDELLGADWAGPTPLAHTVAAEPAFQAAPAPSLLVAPDASDTRGSEPAGVQRPYRLGVSAAFEHFQGGQSYFGGDITMQLPLLVRSAVRLGAGARQGLDADATHGSIRSRAISVASDLQYFLLQVPFELGLGLGAQGEWIEMQGVASDEGTIASEFSGLALYARAAVSVAFHAAGPIWIEVGTSLGLPLRSLEATDAGEGASSATGLQFSSTLTVSIEL